ncbi:Lactonase, 7-bladed beta-propeller-domain-containing protein [Xylariales sp. PMI_506]|nr:Lactonase, 7-bladed beta-propeller-domain-containing protein [Xylariales sp. PMI_506]
MATRTLLVGTSAGRVMVLSFDGTKFHLESDYFQAGSRPSWMAFKEPNFLYIIDSNNTSIHLFHLDRDSKTLSTNPVSSAQASWGTVSLVFNSDQNQLIGSSNGKGKVDIWKISAPDGGLRWMKQIGLQGPIGPNKERQDHNRAHQVICDPSGRFFIVADLGGDSIHVLDSAADSYEPVATVQVSPPGAGPRHGAFLGHAHYVLVCELRSLLLLFKYTTLGGGKVTMIQTQTLSTYGDGFMPRDISVALAGEIAISSNQKDIYVSNRFTGNVTDSISHFVVVDVEGGEKQICFVDQVSSHGKIPRMFSLSKDETLLFSSNEDGENGVVAFMRCPETGKLYPEPVALMTNVLITDKPGFGPQFVMEF